MNQYQILMLYNDQERLEEFISDRLEGESFTYNKKSNCYVIDFDLDGHKFQEKWYISKNPQHLEKARMKFGGIELWSIRYIDGMFDAEVINYLNARVRGGIFEV